MTSLVGMQVDNRTERYIIDNRGIGYRYRTVSERFWKFGIFDIFGMVGIFGIFDIFEFTQNSFNFARLVTVFETVFEYAIV